METIRPDIIAAVRGNNRIGSRPVKLGRWDGGCSGFMLWLYKVLGV